MGDEANFSEKWDFRRKEHSFDDSSSDDPDSNSTHDPIIVQDSNQIDNGTTQTVTREQPTVKTRKRRSKKDETRPEKAKQVRCRKQKTVCAEENKKKEEETVVGMDGVGMFMNTLLDDLTASRESLMDWVKTELCGTSDQNVASPPPLKKKVDPAVAAQRSVKKTRMTKEENERKESEKQSKPHENGQEINEPKQKSPKIAQNGGDQVQEHDCNAGPLDRFLKSGQCGLGRNYFQQQQEGQAQTKTEKSLKSVVLAIEAQTSSQRPKQRREANTTKNRSPMVETKRSETQKDHNLVLPYTPKLASSAPLQRFPIGYPLNSLFACSSQGVTSLDSKSNYQMRQPVAQIPDRSQTGGQGFGNSLFHNNGYFSGFPAAFQPNMIGTGYNFQAQVNPATSSQQRDNNNMFGGLRMAGGAITFSSKRFPEAKVANGIDCVSDNRTSSGR